MKRMNMQSKNLNPPLNLHGGILQLAVEGTIGTGYKKALFPTTLSTFASSFPFVAHPTSTACFCSLSGYSSGNSIAARLSFLP